MSRLRSIFFFSFLTPSNCSSISNRGDQPKVTHWWFGDHTNAGRKVWNCLFSHNNHNLP